ncbi:MAG: Fe-S cluster assembly protein SufD [Candidatus Omnitrophica bacterium]|nr:Fe-S cluster assembly protein SufD [Candidatus Omnitrophota bacterium]
MRTCFYESSEKGKTSGGIHYLSAFQAFEKEYFAADPTWLNSLRKEGIESFRNLGFPSLAHEDWKYTDVRPIAQSLFQPVFAEPNGAVSRKDVESNSFGVSQWPLLVFVDGIFSEKLSCIPKKLPAGLILCSLRKAVREHADIVQAYLGKQKQYPQNSFAALNAAFIYDGLFLYAKSGCELDMPVHAVYVSSPKHENGLYQPRNLIAAESNTGIAVVESYFSFPAHEYFLNAVSEISLAKGASLEFCRVERESEKGFHISTTNAVQHKDSRFGSSVITLGSKVSRNTLQVFLQDGGAECRLDGLYVTRGNEHVDHSTFVKHESRNGTSRQLYKGILDDSSTAVFSGKVYVDKGAQKTDAEQANKNLLLSEKATADTRPQLEIFADDVKCTHGAAVGHLDEEALFYMKSRGIGAAHAQKILTFGFASEVIERLKLKPVKDEIDRLIHDRLDASSTGKM